MEKWSYIDASDFNRLFSDTRHENPVYDGKQDRFHYDGYNVDYARIMNAITDTGHPNMIYQAGKLV